MPTRPTKKEHYDKEAMTFAVYVADYLNDMYVIDPNAITRLFSLWVACGKDLHETPLITRQLHSEQVDGEYAIGALGLINGMMWDDLTVAFVDGKFKVCVRDSHPDNPTVV